MHTSRHVVLYWCLWLLGSWAVSLWLYNLTQASQLMMLATLVGLLLIWPVYRLTDRVRIGVGGQQGRPSLHGVVLMDWVSLLIVCQAVFWPLKMVNNWPWQQALWLNAALVSWSLAAGLMIVWGRSVRGVWARWVAMLLCILMAFGSPLWLASRMWLEGAVLPSDVMQYGPLAGIWVMSYKPTFAQQWMWQGQTLLVGVVACVGWMGLAMIRVSIRPVTSP